MTNNGASETKPTRLLARTSASIPETPLERGMSRLNKAIRTVVTLTATRRIYILRKKRNEETGNEEARYQTMRAQLLNR